ncbi:arylesterase [Shimia sp.]|uniref:arylesterase n=1 Tax=Shimia sp. TaxID=1954381 RepID=UPI00356895E8
MRVESLYGGLKKLGKVAAVVLLWSAPLAAEPQTVVAMGDSLTQGYGLAPDDGFVAQMQRWLDRQGAGVRLTNAGVSGDTTAGGAARIDWTLAEAPDAMIVTLGANDMLRGLDPAEARRNLATILAAAQGRGIPVLLVGIEAAGNYGPAYKAQFEAIYGDLAQQFAVLHSDNFFAGLGSSDPAEVSALMQADGIHPNAEGVARIVEALGPDVLALIDSIGG